MEIQTVNFDNSGMYRCAFKKGKYAVSAHIHQCSEVVIIMGGELNGTVEGEKKTLRAGDVAVITPFSEHSFTSKSGAELWICVFSNSLLNGVMANDELYQPRSSSFFKISDELLSFLKQRLPDSSEEMVPFNYEAQRKMLIILLAIFDEYFAATDETTNTKNQKSLLAKILIYLDKHYSEPLNIHSVSKALGYTPRHISRQLTPLHEYNFRTLLNLFRVDRAKMKLRQSDAKIIDISLECGFVSERSFFRSFLKVEGLTPTEYRKAIKQFGRHYRERGYQKASLPDGRESLKDSAESLG